MGMRSQGLMTLFPIGRVVYGRPAAEAVVEESERLGAKRVFLLVANSLKTQTDAITEVEKALGDRHAFTVAGVPPHTPESAVLAATASARRERADLLVSIGGGSVTDAAKVILVCLEHGIDTHQKLAEHRMKWSNGSPLQPPFGPPRIPMIAVPTTLSASEYTPIGSATDDATRAKNAYGHLQLNIASIILDPKITLHTPEWLWLSTGIRAVDHAAEGLASLRSNDFCDGLDASALRLLGSNLARVKANPSDMEARLTCQMGSWQATMPLSHTAMGLSHAISHALGSACHVPYGYTSCVMLPHVFAWNRKANAERQERVAECLGRPGAAAAEVLNDLIGRLGLPQRLRDVGVREEQLVGVAGATMHSHCTPANPRPVAGPEDVMEVLKAAY
jgi:maleylacetate reductase